MLKDKTNTNSNLKTCVILAAIELSRTRFCGRNINGKKNLLKFLHLLVEMIMILLMFSTLYPDKHLLTRNHKNQHQRLCQWTRCRGSSNLYRVKRTTAFIPKQNPLYKFWIKCFQWGTKNNRFLGKESIRIEEIVMKKQQDSFTTQQTERERWVLSFFMLFLILWLSHHLGKRSNAFVFITIRWPRGKPLAKLLYGIFLGRFLRIVYRIWTTWKSLFRNGVVFLLFMVFFLKRNPLCFCLCPSVRPQ